VLFDREGQRGDRCRADWRWWRGLIFYYEDGKHQLREAVVNEGLEERRFRFDFSGSKIIYNV
jgi:hypothetical protein